LPPEEEEDSVAYVVTSACIDESTFEPECERVCRAGAIHRGRFTRLIDPEACTDCGECEPVCPVGAIFAEAKVPAPEQMWIGYNRNWRQQV
jgi:ferredoxin